MESFLKQNITQTKIKRVAAYCRVSTSSNKQHESIEAQKEHFDMLISSNANWIYAGLFYDEGLSGTKLYTRPGFLALMEAAKRGEIDLIITKSISRFSRNTKDLLKCTRELFDLGVEVHFERENIYTLSMEGELMLSVLSSFAQNESESTSANIKWGKRATFQDGTYMPATAAYGYKIEDGKMILDEIRADAVKLIFEHYLNGDRVIDIIRFLEKEHYPAVKDRKWNKSLISYIIRNMNYTGDLLCQKVYSNSSFKLKRNSGEEPMYLIQNHHEAIISHETFEKAQKEIERRRNRYKNPNEKTNLVRYPLSSKVFCGLCGSAYTRTAGTEPMRSCSSTQTAGGCKRTTILEDAIYKALGTLRNKLIASKQIILQPLINTLRDNIDFTLTPICKKADEKAEKNLEERRKLSEKQANGEISFEKYSAKLEVLLSEYTILCEERQKAYQVLGAAKTKLEEVRKLFRYLRVTKISSELGLDILDPFIEKIEVFSKERELTFHFFCGLSLKEKY